jgi:hypothetical protein
MHFRSQLREALIDQSTPADAELGLRNGVPPLQREAALQPALARYSSGFDLLFFTPPERVPTLQGAPVLLWSILSVRFTLLPASKPSALVFCDSPTTPLTSYQRIHIRIILSGHGEEKEAFLGTSRCRRSARYAVKTNKSTSAPV